MTLGGESCRYYNRNLFPIEVFLRNPIREDEEENIPHVASWGKETKISAKNANTDFISPLGENDNSNNHKIKN